MTLDQGIIGRAYEVEETHLALGVEKRLEALGMTHGTKIEVLNSKSGGTLIIKVRGSRFAVGRGIASKITVGGCGQ
ncbi:MAG: FeoA domain-containing protein [Eggerthellaceae bacterium]